MSDAPKIALLRAVNVGGRGLKMEALRAMVAGLGYTDVRSLMQSGNLVFRGGGNDDAQVEKRLEAATAEQFGIETDYLVRRPDEWRAMIEANPFATEAADDPAHLIVMPLKSAPVGGAVERLRAAIKGRERVEVAGRNAYLVYPDGVGESKLTIKVVERHLGARGTGRNWNTVMKLAAMVEV